MISTLTVNDTETFTIICEAFKNQISQHQDYERKAVLFAMFISFVKTNWIFVNTIDSNNIIRLSLVFLIKKHIKEYKNKMPRQMVTDLRKDMITMFGFEVVNLIN